MSYTHRFNDLEIIVEESTKTVLEIKYIEKLQPQNFEIVIYKSLAVTYGLNSDHNDFALMKKNVIYKGRDIETVWRQFEKNSNSVVWSGDKGKTWNDFISKDVSEWEMFSIINDKKVNWIYKLKSSKL